MKASWRDYYEVTKPRIIFLNLVAAFGGYWLASRGHVEWGTLLPAMFGTALVMASSCVFNNYFDMDFDRKMERTRNRPLPMGKIEPSRALAYAVILGVIGEALLFSVGWLVGVLGLVGMFVYVVIYTLWLKRSSTWSTSVGGISGAMPPVIGYTAVTGELDLGAWLLFAVLFLWQPPHFWALGIFRTEEYRAAGYPLLPVVKGVKRTKVQMLPYVTLLFAANILLYAYRYVGLIYLVVIGLLTLAWVIHSWMGLAAKDDEKWARKNFLFSVNYLLVLFVVMVIDTAAYSS